MLSLRGNIAYNRNKVIDLYYADRIYTSEEALLPDYEVGKSYDMKMCIRDRSHSTGPIYPDRYNVYAVEMYPDSLSFYINDMSYRLSFGNSE